MHIKALKKSFQGLLLQQKPDAAIDQLAQMKLRRVINPLISFFCSGNELLRWRAVTVTGALISIMADEAIEDARVMMRRLMWTLNDESGGIGWGAPETMGEAMSRNQKLAGEYAAILVSYLNPCGNFLEHPLLQRGVLWGIGRLANSRRQSAREAAPYLGSFMESRDPIHRGLAAWSACALAPSREIKIPEHIKKDDTIVSVYAGDDFRDVAVNKLATVPFNVESK